MGPRAADDIYDDAAIAEAQRAVLAANPMAGGRFGVCSAGPFPLWKMAVPGLAEHGASEEADGLRAFLADNPWGDMFPVTAAGWVLLAESEGKVCFGQREGDFGLGPIVTLTHRNGQWEPSQLGGSSGLYLGPNEQPASIESARLGDSTLEVTWAGTYGEQTVVRVETVRNTTGMYVLIVVTVPEPGWYITGSRGTLNVQLEASADDAIFDAAYVPSRPVMLSPDRPKPGRRPRR